MHGEGKTPLPIKATGFSQSTSTKDNKPTLNNLNKKKGLCWWFRELHLLHELLQLVQVVKHASTEMVSG